MTRSILPEAAGTTVAEWWPQLIGPALIIVATLVGAVLLRWVLHRAIDRMVNNALARAADHENQTPRRASRVLSQATGLSESRKTQRAATMGAILKSTATFFIVGIALLTIMATLGVQLAPLLASAGVVGVALAFGAQSLVKDVLSSNGCKVRLTGSAYGKEKPCSTYESTEIPMRFSRA